MLSKRYGIVPIVCTLLFFVACTQSAVESESVELTSVPSVEATATALPPTETIQAPSETSTLEASKTPVPSATKTRTPASSGIINTPLPNQQEALSAPTDRSSLQCEVRNDWFVYTIQSGDTLGKIAQSANTSVQALVEANCLANSNQIVANQVLRVPVENLVLPTQRPDQTEVPTATFSKTPVPSSTPMPEPTCTKNTNLPSYTVSSWDEYLYEGRSPAIVYSLMLNVTIEEFLSVNCLSASDSINEGDVLYMPGNFQPSEFQFNPAQTSIPEGSTCSKNTNLPSYTVGSWDQFQFEGQRLAIAYSLMLNVTIEEFLTANCLSASDSINEGDVLYMPGNFQPAEFNFTPGQACPYVYSFDETTGEWIFETTILYKIIGKDNETSQIRTLKNFNGQLLIREVEPETSYINEVYMLISDHTGQQYKLYSELGQLAQSDEYYLVIEQGEEITLHFDGFGDIQNIIRYEIVAEGYYVPYDFANVSALEVEG